MKTRITAKLLKDSYPPKVYEEIVRIGDNHYIESFFFQEVDSSKLFYVGEGESYCGIHSDGRIAEFEVQSQHNIGASGLSQKIGSQFSMPAGSWLIRTYYYDKYYMEVFKIKEN